MKQATHQRQRDAEDIAVVDGGSESQGGVVARGEALNVELDTSQPIEDVLSAWTAIDASSSTGERSPRAWT